MKKAVWLSYDLGVKGDYSGLYRWLDNHRAKECGVGLAFFNYEVEDAKNLTATLKADLQREIDFDKADRIYIAYRGENDWVKGNFIIGKRKGAPWAGYGDAPTEEDS